MEAQMQRQHGHNGDEQQPSFGVTPVTQGQDEAHQDHEKKSVFKNVKDKAKKKAKQIKETLTKHGHGHENDHDRQSHEEDDKDDDVDDEELVEDPEVHGEPMYESVASRSGVGSGQQHGVNLEKPTIMQEDRYSNTITDPPTRPFSEWEHDKTEQGEIGNIERGIGEKQENPKVKIGNPTETKEDQNAPKERREPSDYQSKVANPTDAVYESDASRSGVGFGQQHGVNLEKPTVIQEDRYSNTITDPPTRPFSEWEHEKPEQGQIGNIERGIGEKQENPKGKIGNPTETKEDQNAPKERQVPSNYQSKVADPTGAVYESAAIRSGVGAGQQHGVNLEKPTVTQEDRYSNTITNLPTRPFSESEHEKTEEGQIGDIERGIDEKQGNPKVKIGNPTEMEEDQNVPKERQEPSNYQSKVADLSAAGGADAGITPILQSFDKMSVHDEPYPEDPMSTGSHDQFSPEPIPENAPLDPKEAISSGEKQTGYTEKISSATSALTGKAVAAKNAITSKLGYGEKEGAGISSTEKEGSGILGSGKEGSGISGTGGTERTGGVVATVADYGNRAMATVTGTLTSVTEKVAGIGSSVPSKVQGGSTEPTEENKGVKGYLSEKLSPSEEDKALSEVISDALRRKKQEPEDKPVGKVTVSEEVARRLGTEEEDPKREKDGTDAGVVGNAQPAVVERVKSWFGMGQPQGPQASQGNTNVGDEQLSSSIDTEGERRLRDSAN